MTNDIHGVVDAFIAITIAETIVKPSAIRLGRWILAHADRRWHWIPDWLHTSKPDA